MTEATYLIEGVRGLPEGAVEFTIRVRTRRDRIETAVLSHQAALRLAADIKIVAARFPQAAEGAVA